MTATVCAACMGPLMPRIERCFDCDLGAPASDARLLQRWRADGAAGDPSRLARALSRLAPRLAAPDVAWIVRQRRFDLVADLTEGQAQGLAVLLRVCGVRFELLQGPVRLPLGVRFAWDRQTPTKLGASVAIGGAAACVGLPLVPWAAVAMSVLLVARAARVTPREVALGRPEADELLGNVDAQTMAELRAARVTLTEPELLEIVRALAGHLAEIAGRLREDASHLTVALFSRADSALVELGRSSLRLAVAANRIGPRSDPPEDPSGRRYGRSIRGYEEKTARLRRVEEGLGETRALMLSVRTGDAGSQALVSVLRAFEQLHADCVAALGDSATREGGRRSSRPIAN